MSRRLLLRLLASAPRTDHVSDAELLRRFVASNDSAAFELIVRRHADAVWAACRRVLRNDADAEDAFQATFLVLIRKARSVRTPCAGGWLHRVAVNAALKLRARAARTAALEPNQLDAIPAGLASAPDPELATALHEELAKLSEQERLPIVLCDLEGMSHADAATTLGWPVGTVSGRLSRARAKLRAHLERRGLAPSAALFPALGAPAHLIPSTLSLTAGSASPAVVSLTEGVLAMTSTTWKWVAVATVCVGMTGAAVGLMQPGAGPLPDGAAPPVRAADDPAPEGKDKPAGQQALPKPGADLPGKATAHLGPTAFPDLVLPEPDYKDPDWQQKQKAAFEKLCPRFAGKITSEIEPTDDTYRKLLKARLNMGLKYMTRIREVIRIGSWTSAFFLDTCDCLVDLETTVLELYGTQTKELIPWLEELVVVAKEAERFTYIRVLNGSDPPQRLDTACRHRYRAEATLWKAKRRA